MNEDAELINKINFDELLSQIAATDEPDVFLNALSNGSNVGDRISLDKADSSINRLCFRASEDNDMFA